MLTLKFAARSITAIHFPSGDHENEATSSNVDKGNETRQDVKAELYIVSLSSETGRVRSVRFFEYGCSEKPTS